MITKVFWITISLVIMVVLVVYSLIYQFTNDHLTQTQVVKQLWGVYLLVIGLWLNIIRLQNKN